MVKIFIRKPCRKLARLSLHSAPMLPPAEQDPTADAALDADGPRLRIDLLELEKFLTVAKLHSFSAAARQLHLSQSFITARVQRLEAELGVQLLVRSTRRVAITPQGERLRAEAEKTLAGLRFLIGRFKAESQAGRRRLSCACMPRPAATSW